MYFSHSKQNRDTVNTVVQSNFVVSSPFFGEEVLEIRIFELLQINI